MTVTPHLHPLQGIKAMMSGSQIGGTTITTGDGSPAAVMVALRIGDIYVDYTNGAIYVAGATGTGGWATFSALASAAATFDVGTNLTVGGTAEITGTLTQTGVATFTAAPVLPTATKIGGVTINTYSGTPAQAAAAGSAAAVPARIGDIWINYGAGTGKIYVASAVATCTDFKIVTSA